MGSCKSDTTPACIRQVDDDTEIQSDTRVTQNVSHVSPVSAVPV